MSKDTHCQPCQVAYALCDWQCPLGRTLPFLCLSFLSCRDIYDDTGFLDGAAGLGALGHFKGGDTEAQGWPMTCLGSHRAG